MIINQLIMTVSYISYNRISNVHYAAGTQDIPIIIGLQYHTLCDTL